MRTRALLLSACLLALPAVAQDSEPGLFDRLFGTDTAETDEQQGSLLERLIEDNLSGDGRQVSISGFSGALSGRATLESLTVSDAEGEWLTLNDAVLDWNRAALFSGRLEIAELAAEKITLPRLPLPAESDIPTPEASGFSLPELPVSIDIGTLAAAEVEIGQTVIGVPVRAAINGALSLAGGEGAANLTIERLDNVGNLSLDAGYSNTSTLLAMNLSLDEGPNGILSNLLDLPERPALSFQLKGEAPLAAFAADIALSTDGQQRLGGRIINTQTEDGSNRTSMNIRGDLAPVFAPEYRPFFGDDVWLRGSVATLPNGGFELTNLDLSTAALTLKGTASVSNGMPSKIDLSGRIGSDNGEPVVLPISGVPTTVEQVDLQVKFFGDISDDWTSLFRISGLRREGFAAESIEVLGVGEMGPGRIAAPLQFRASNLDLGDAKADAALGESVDGQVEINWEVGSPIAFENLSINGESYGLNGRAEVTNQDDGPRITGQAIVRAERLAAFAGIANRDLSGAAELDTRFDITPFAGRFEVSANGTTRDLIVDQEQADRVFAGEGQLQLTASRDESGIRVNIPSLRTDQAELAGSLSLLSGGSQLSLSAQLADAALILPEVSGPITLEASAEEDADRVWAWRSTANMEGTELKASGNAIDIYRRPVISATGTLSASNLSDFSTLAGRPLGGSTSIDFAGEIAADLTRSSVSAKGTTRDLVVGQTQADALLRGVVEFDIDTAKAGDVITLRESTVKGPQVALTANGILVPEAGRFALAGEITDAAVILEGAPNQPLRFAGEGAQDGRDWRVKLDGRGAGLAIAAEGIALDPTGALGFDGTLSASAETLSILSDLAKRPLKGALSVTAKGSIQADLSRFDLMTSATGNDIGIGEREVDRLLAGAFSLELDAMRSGGAIEVTSAKASTSLLTASASGSLGPNESELALEARLANIASFVDGLNGPLSVQGTVGQSDDQYTVNLSASGPGGAQADATGTVALDLATTNISLNGTAPLGLANRFIGPNAISGIASFDMALNGPPALNSVSGRVTSSGARFVAPVANIALNDIQLNTTIENGRATLLMQSAVENGGRLGISGPVTLAAPFNGDLRIDLGQVILRDPKLYETDVTGAVTINGPLAGGALIAGQLNLGETNVRIPSSSLGGSGAVPEIIHINETPPIRGTRRRAGLLDQTSGSNGAGPVYPLDVVVDAPNRIFVRGRGLDSEFGGQLRITGTSKNVVPLGAFNLIRGRLDILGQRLSLEEARVTMQGSFIPVLQLRASTQADEYAINVNVLGEASDPEISFTSDPDLPQEEVLARLIFGRGLETLSPLQAARLALAVRTLAGKGGEGVVSKLRQGSGLADLDVSTDEDGNAAVRAGAYLGENIYTDVTVDSAGETELNLNLDVSPSVTLKGSVTNEGDSSLGIFFERDY